MKHLCILRHAETVSPETAIDDPSRDLTTHGRSQCADRARRLPDTRFDLILASTAQRTRETARIVFGDRGIVTAEPKLYNAGLQALLALVHATCPDYQSLAVVGHNPGMSELAGFLAGRPSHLAPASLLVFDLSGEWADAGPSSARLTTAMLD